MCVCTDKRLASRALCSYVGDSTRVCFHLHTLCSISVRECILAEVQVRIRQQRDLGFFCQVTQRPIIPHKPPCLQAGDSCVSLCVCGFQSLIWWHQQTEAVLMLLWKPRSHQSVTLRSNQQAKLVTAVVKPYQVQCLPVETLLLLIIKTRPLLLYYESVFQLLD